MAESKIPNHRRVKWSPSTEEGRRNLLRLKELKDKGLTHVQIAKLFGVEKNTISVICHKYNLIGERTPPSVAMDRARAVGAVFVPGNKSLSMRARDIFGSNVQNAEPPAKLSDDDIKYYRNHLSEFVDKYIYWNGLPLKLDPLQKEILNSTGRFEIWNKSARVGLSFAMSLRAFLRSIFYPGTVTLFVSVKEERAKELLTMYVYAFEESPITRGCIIEPHDNRAVFDNGSMIHSLTSSGSGARGIPSGGQMDINLDELAHYLPGRDDAMWAALSRNFPLGATMRIWSTPHWRKGTFYELWEKAVLGQGEFRFKPRIFNWQDCSRITKAEVDAFRKDVGDVIANQEYENMFTDIGDTLFPSEVIEASMKKVDMQPVDGYPCFLGLDFAMGGGDRFAMAASQKIDDNYIVRYLREYDLHNESQVLRIVGNANAKYRPLRIFGDNTGMGIPLISALRSELGAKVEGVDFTSQSKDEMVMNLWNLLHDGKLTLPQNKTLLIQLSNLGVERTMTGRYAYRHRPGFRDDLVWATMLSCFFQRPRWKGFLSIGTSGGQELTKETSGQVRMTYEDAIKKQIMSGIDED